MAEDLCMGIYCLDVRIYEWDTAETIKIKTDKLTGMRTFFSFIAFIIAILTITILGFIGDI